MKIPNTLSQKMLLILQQNHKCQVDIFRILISIKEY